MRKINAELYCEGCAGQVLLFAFSDDENPVWAMDYANCLDRLIPDVTLLGDAAWDPVAENATEYPAHESREAMLAHYWSIRADVVFWRYGEERHWSQMIERSDEWTPSALDGTPLADRIDAVAS